jgi:hypothetical protein
MQVWLKLRASAGHVVLVEWPAAQLGSTLSKCQSESCLRLLPLLGAVPQVLMLVWDDKSNNYPLPIAGVMGTHDNETYAFFKGSKVVCLLCPRQGGTEDSYLQVRLRGREAAVRGTQGSGRCDKLAGMCIRIMRREASTGLPYGCFQ